MGKEEIANALLDVGAVSINAANPFKYASGMMNPIYTNCRVLISYPKERKAVVDGFIDFIDREIGRDKIDVIVGTASSGISLATYLAERLKLPMAYIRSAPKDHGKGRQIEGLIKEGSRVLLVSDIISTEQDIPVSVRVLREHGCEIVCCIAISNNNLNIIDKFLDDEKIMCHTLTDLQTLLSMAHKNGRLSPLDKEHAAEWMKDPEGWGRMKKENVAKSSSESKKRVAESLLKIQAVTLNTKAPYKFASGILGPIYTDCRLLMSYPKEWQTVMEAAISVMVNEIGMQYIDVIGGTATAGISHAAYLSQRLGLPMVYIKTSDENGKKTSRIEGVLNRGGKVVIIDDLISTGGSLLDSVQAVRGAGGIVDNCLSIFNYGMEKARKAFEENGIRIFSLTDLGVLLDVAIRQGYIKENEKSIIQDWVKDPENWGRKTGFE